MISFGFYSTNFKVYIYLLCINTQRRTTSPFYDTPVISSSNFAKTGLYQGSANHYEGDRNSDIICLFQKSQEVHYCNQSVLAIVPDLKIFVFSINFFDPISKSALVRFSVIRSSYLYNSTGLRFQIFCL